MTHVLCDGSGAQVGPRFVRRFPVEFGWLRITTCQRCWQNVPCSRPVGAVAGSYIIADHAVKETLTPTVKAG